MDDNSAVEPVAESQSDQSFEPIKKSFWQNFLSSKSKVFGVLVILIIVAAVPLTVLISQQQQNVQQHASGTSTRYDNTDSRITYTGTWATFAKSGIAYGNSYTRSSTANATASITFSGTKLDIIAMKGTTTCSFDAYLDGTKIATIPTTATTAVYQQDLWSTGDLTSGVHTVKIVRSSTCASGKFITLDAADIWETNTTNITPTPTSTSTSPAPTQATRYDDTNSNITKTGTWATFAKSGIAYNNSYTRSSTVNASASIPFNGTKLDIITMKGTTTCSMDIYLDGTLKTTVNTAATTAVYKQDLWSTGDITNGAHTVKIVRSSSCASGKFITLDAVDIWGTIGGTTTTISLTPTPTSTQLTATKYDDTNSNITYTGTWAKFAKANIAYNNSYTRSSTANASASIPFTGTKLDIIAMKGTTTCAFDVYLDGTKKDTIQTAVNTAVYQQDLWSTGDLSNDNHTVKIVRSSSCASGKFITLDAVNIWGTIGSSSVTPTPTGTDNITPTPGGTGGGINFNLHIGLDGVGSAGDHTSPCKSTTFLAVPTCGDNITNIKDTTRSADDALMRATITLYDSSNNPTSATSALTYNSQTGLFDGATEMGGLPDGTYSIKVSVPGFLSDYILPIQHDLHNSTDDTAAAATYDLNPVSLTNGDINADNSLSVTDYQILMSCLSPQNGAVASFDNYQVCNQDPNFAKLSDLNDDGVIDYSDFILFEREFAVQYGK